MNNRKAEIDKIMVKNKSIPYANAVSKIKKDRKGYYQQKDIKLKSKSLSTDRFQQYLKTIQEEDDTN
jgi:predicted acetyltransferase